MVSELTICLIMALLVSVGASPEQQRFNQPRPMRVVQVDLDYVYDADEVQQERNLSTLVRRVRDLHATTVFLQAFADPKGEMVVSEVYFPSRLLRTRADLFGLAAARLRSEAHVEIYAWMPVLAFNFGRNLARVEALNPETGESQVATKGYLRLSPFDAEARKSVVELYEELARTAGFTGLFFSDDATLSDLEDASAPAQNAYRQAGLPPSVRALRADPALDAAWTRLKEQSLEDLLKDITRHVSRIRGRLTTARNLYARPVLSPSAIKDFAQDPEIFLKTYDYAVVMAMPDLENVPTGDARAWIAQLVAATALHDPGLARTMFELQSVDWRRPAGDPDRSVPAAILVDEMNLLRSLGAVNFGYYPDDFVKNRPDAQSVGAVFASQPGSVP